MEGTLHRGGAIQPLGVLPAAERLLVDQDRTLAAIIRSQSVRWPAQATEDPIWGLLRIVIAQQISTHVAHRLAERVKAIYPSLTLPSPTMLPEVTSLRALGIPERRAKCCVSILRRSDELRAKVKRGQTWEEILVDIKGIGPWTISVFRIMVLRHPDVLPLGDVGLERAVSNVYGTSHEVTRLSENWKPFRSVASWYLWRTLGNMQLG